MWLSKFFKPSWQTDDLRKARAVVGKMVEQKKLAQVAKESNIPDIRILATGKLDATIIICVV